MFELFVDLLSEARSTLMKKGHSEEETELFLLKAFDLALTFALDEYIKIIGEDAASTLAKAVQSGNPENIQRVIHEQGEANREMFLSFVKGKLEEILAQ